MPTNRCWRSTQRPSGAAQTDRLQYYFITRASDHDLLGDLDAWEIQYLRDSDKSLDTIDGLIAVYYAVTRAGGIRELTAQRRSAIERFLQHHGFTYDRAVDPANYPTVLPSQSKPARVIARLIEQFAQIWMYKQNPNLLFYNDPSKTAPQWIQDMTNLYLFWVEGQALENGANA
jgi:hypothetical protein